jgi:uncharacterized protein YjiS (DUF1127 family)
MKSTALLCGDGRGSLPMVRRLVAGILAFVTIVKRAIEAELAARQAMAELAELDDRMLRDLRLSRSEIENKVRRPVADD